jgi:hypothetical protein
MPALKKVAKAFERAASVFKPGQYALAGKVITCPHCGRDVFEKREAQLNTALRTFFNMDWLDESATVLVCVECGQIQWFGKSPTKKG